jgi:hypothetical protein
MTRDEAIAQIKASPNEHWHLVRASQRHKRFNGEPKKYIKIECEVSQRMAFYEAWEGIVEKWGKTRALDRLIVAMSDANCADLDE